MIQASGPGLTIPRQQQPVLLRGVPSAEHALAGEIVVTAVQPASWQSLLEKFPHHSVFHRLPWLQSIEKVHKAKLRLVRADIGAECVAIWPVFATRKGPLPILGSPLGGWSTPYLGPLFAPGCDVQRALTAMLSHPMLRRASYFACKSLTTGDQAIDLKPHGFTNVLEFETYSIDLTIGRDALWDNLKSECRTRIRKAQKLGLQIRHESDGSFLEEYWAMSIETFAITHIQPMFTKPFIEEVWRRLFPAGEICGMSAFLNGERIAALVLPFDGHTIYYWTGAGYVKHRAIPAHNLLQWTAIELAQSMGLRTYDFISTLGGAGRFKRTFSPQTVHIADHWERTSSRIVNALKVGYERYLMMRNRAKPVDSDD